MENCIFCKIIRGELPCYKIYEDEKVLAFLDLHPLSQGHTLVIPKKHAQDIFEIEPEELKQLILVVQKLSRIIMEKLGAQGINILQRNKTGAGQEVSHMHFHIVPRFDGDSVALPPESGYKEEDIKNIHERLTPTPN